jgi:tRNA threonylcarbamoyladenosine biosynthesis protein TsaB
VTAKPFVLAVESSGRMGSVAIAAGPELLAEKSITGPMRHSSELFPGIQQLLAGLSAGPDDIKDVYISIGPGSFTGLRIAVTIAKMMNLALGTRIVTVDTLDVIAANIDAAGTKRLAVVLDAKRNQFFAAAYESRNGQWHKTIEDSLITA